MMLFTKDPMFTDVALARSFSPDSGSFMPDERAAAGLEYQRFEKIRAVLESDSCVGKEYGPATEDSLLSAIAKGEHLDNVMGAQLTGDEGSKQIFNAPEWMPDAVKGQLSTLTGWDQYYAYLLMAEGKDKKEFKTDDFKGAYGQYTNTQFKTVKQDIVYRMLFHTPMSAGNKKPVKDKDSNPASYNYRGVLSGAMSGETGPDGIHKSSSSFPLGNGNQAGVESTRLVGVNAQAQALYRAINFGANFDQYDDTQRYVAKPKGTDSNPTP